jgi:pyridoxine 4-dehydrogenase
MPVIIPIPGASNDKRVKENSKVVDLTEQEMAEIDEILKTFTVAGDRYYGPGMSFVNG